MKQKVITRILLTTLCLLGSAASASITWYANGVSGNNSNNCMSPQTACKTIGHAISLASSGDTIMVAAATYTEHLTIGFSLKVVGSDAGTTIIDGGQAGRVVTISSSVTVTLSKVTIRNGLAPFGGGIYNNGDLFINNSTVTGNFAFIRCCYSAGGAIYNVGYLTINKSTVSGNVAGCGVTGCAGYGGAIYNNYGGVLINNSALNGNSAYGHYAYSKGGAIFGGATINNSTLSGNSANRGGAIFGGAMLKNSTLSGNRAYVPGQGGGIFGNVTLQNSIVANSPSGGNCYGTVTSQGYNLSSDSTCNLNSPGDLNNTDPKLGTFGYYGGPTETIPLLSVSPAIDAGNPGGCTDAQGHLLTTDQRGMPRPDKEDSIGCDIGAYESQSD